VQRFPQLGDRQQISIDGGQVPHWSPSGRELFFLSGDGRRLMAVPVESGPMFKVGKAVVLFEGTVLTEGPSHSYDVMPDGKRFVVIKNAPRTTRSTESAEIVVVHDWAAEANRR
jgi:hypothetical protein